MILFCSLAYLNRIFSQSLVVGVFAVIGLLSGVIPNFSENSNTLVFSTAAYAQQTVTDKEVTDFANAIMEIEELRQDAFGEIKNMFGGNVPEIVCNDNQSINNLPTQVRNAVQDFCNESSAVVEDHFPQGKNSRFNQIANLMQNNPSLRQRIQNEMRRILRERQRSNR
ncbi:MAG: DUF4168 domain-containing protein [Coleofasciculaceae cyanobacterium]